MNKLLAALTCVALLGLAMPASAQADECDTDDSAIAVGDYYVILDAEQGGLWVYEESNGAEGAQRSSEDKGDCSPDDADTIIF